MQRDYYEILGITKSATIEEIKSAFRKIAMQCHPDRASEDSEAESKFKEASEAYDTLSDIEKRRRYDLGKNQANSFNADMFSGFGGLRAHPFASKQRGADIEKTCAVNLKDLFKESFHKISYPRIESCKKCSGNGTNTGKSKSTCFHCKGTGQSVRQQQQSFIQQLIVTPCSNCEATGSVADVEDKCTECNGIGRKENIHTLEFTIPIGMPIGRMLIFSGEGNCGLKGGPNGDLYIRVVPSEGQNLKVNSDAPHDLVCELKIPYWKAALGGSLLIEGADGSQLTIEVPMGCPCNSFNRVRGAGLPIFGRSERGDLVVIFQIHVPKNLSFEMKAIIEKLKELEA